MKKLLGIMVLGLLLSGCAYGNASSQTNINGTIGNYYYEGAAVSEAGRCYGSLKVTNNYDDIKSPIFKLIAHDSNGVNIDSITFKFQDLFPGETIFRKDLFFEVLTQTNSWGCSVISNIKVLEK